MKNILMNVTLIIAVFCPSNFRHLVFDRLFTKQVALNHGYANITKLVRNKLPRSSIKNIVSCDTIFLIERVDEVTKRVEGSIWCSNNKTVVSYNNNTKDIDFTKIDIHKFRDPLKEITERFDTMSINRTSTYLGASQVFVSQIAGSNIRTYFFSDITSPSFFVKPK